MFIITRRTVMNPAALETRTIPRKFLGRATLWPRYGGWRLYARVVFELEALRYLVALLPFILALLVWPQHALAIAQAPIPMLIVIYLFESRLLRASPAQAKTLATEVEADRGLDLLRMRGRQILGRIAAGREMESGRLHLVIEQSEMLRVPVLSYVSVQYDDLAGGRPALMNLTEDEIALLREKLFAEPLDERALQRIGLMRKIALHDIPFEPEKLSAHARLAAMMARAAP